MCFARAKLASASRCHAGIAGRSQRQTKCNTLATLNASNINNAINCSASSGWGGAVPLWGGEVAKTVKYLNQGGTLWVFRSPQQMASN
jgi:hypothetical protein